MRKPTINLVLWDNGVGLTRDMHLLRDVWTEAGFAVTVTARRRGTLRKWLAPLRLKGRMALQKLRGDDPLGRFDYNVMLEHIRPEYVDAAKRNVLVPNPEWLGSDDQERIELIDLVLAKTRHAEALFARLGCPTHRFGFTSDDRLDGSVQKDRTFFHLAGRSRHKGTDALLGIWQKHPNWPLLTVVQNPRMAKERITAPNILHRVDYLSDAELKRLQNSNLFHLCPSETEGFGHYIVEALSAGAIVLTLDAPPMNELVSTECGLLFPYSRTGKHGLATTYHFDEAALSGAIAAALALDPVELQRLSNRARETFERIDSRFRQTAAAAFDSLAAEPPLMARDS